MKSITIKTKIGKLDVIAKIIGHFAVHPTVGVDDGTFSVTHIPTGYSFPMSCRSEAFALAFAALLNNQPMDWNIKDPHEFVSKFTEVGKSSVL